MFKHRLAGILFAVFIIVDIGVWVYMFLPVAGHSTSLDFLDIGQGDSEFIQLSGGAQIIIDGGPSGSALLKNLAKVMPPQDRYIDLLLMTHPQLDHFAGFIDVLKNYQVGAFIGNGRKGDIAAYQQLHQELVAHHVPYIQVKEGDIITIGDSHLTVLSPSPTDLLSGELNDTCLVTMLETPQLRALYTCDAGANIESEIVKKYNLNADILKVGHHGSRFSSSEAFLQAVAPKISVIEVGAHNTYGHPTQEALDRLQAVGTKIFRTDKDGLIKIVSGANGLVASSLK